MKLGVFTVLFGDKQFEEVLGTIAERGLDSIEIGTGGYPGDAHCKPEELLNNNDKLEKFKKVIEDHGLEISALSCHGNPLHPNPEVANKHHEQFQNTVRLAEKLGVDTVVTFSGCPGESEFSHFPVWVTSAWPEDHPKVLEWQWKEKVIPYWTEQSNFYPNMGCELQLNLILGLLFIIMKLRYGYVKSAETTLE